MLPTCTRFLSIAAGFAVLQSVQAARSSQFDIDPPNANVQPPGEIRIVDDDLTRNMALYQAAKKNAALQPLAPQRPPDAVTCSLCGGSGVLPEPHTNWMCSCGGLGWTPFDAVPGSYKF